MKQVASLVLLLIAGCGRKSQIADAQSLFRRSRRVCPTGDGDSRREDSREITEKANTRNQSWSETHLLHVNGVTACITERAELQRAEESGEVGRSYEVVRRTCSLANLTA